MTVELTWPDIGMLEVVYTWDNGREEVLYCRHWPSRAAADLMKEVDELKAKNGAASPYSYRMVPLGRNER